jgi:hypothetical protein
MLSVAEDDHLGSSGLLGSLVAEAAGPSGVAVTLTVNDEDSLRRVLERLSAEKKGHFDETSYHFERLTGPGGISHPLDFYAQVKDLGYCDIVLVNNNSASYGMVTDPVSPSNRAFKEPFSAMVSVKTTQRLSVLPPTGKRDGYDCRLSIDRERRYLLHQPGPTIACERRLSSASSISDGRPRKTSMFHKIGAFLGADRGQPEAIVFTERRLVDLDSMDKTRDDPRSFQVSWVGGPEAPPVTLTYKMQDPQTAQEFMALLQSFRKRV